MFKVAYVSTVDGLKEARGLLKQIYDENPKHWPAGLTPEHFDGGLYLVREARTRRAVGFCGWQERNEVEALKHSQLKESGSRLEPQWDNWFKSLGCRHIKTGYYSIGILPEFRNNGFAKAALQKLISIKAAGVDRVKALIMSSNKPSLALADSLGVEKVVKQAFTLPWQDRDRTVSDFVPGGLVGAGLGTGIKFDRDLSQAEGRLKNWQQSMARYHGLTGAKNYTGRLDPGVAAQIIDDYIVHGQATAQSRLLGVPAGRVLQGLVTPFNRYSADHYRMFSDPSVTLPELRRHMIDKAVTHRFGAEYANPQTFSPEMKANLDRWTVQKSYSLPNVNKLFSYKYRGTPAAQMLDSALYGSQGNVSIRDIGEAMRLAGNRGTVMSTPDIYSNMSRRFLIGPWSRIRKPVGIAGGLATLGLLGHAAFGKKSSTDWRINDVLAGSGLVGLGVGTGVSGLNDTLNPNRRIGVTYGEIGGPWGLGDVGHGHKSPALAIEEMLQKAIVDRPEWRQFSTHRLPRNRAGIPTGPQGKYNVMLDTGLGAHNAEFVSGPRITHKTGGGKYYGSKTHMPVLTDMAPLDRHRFGATWPSQANHEFLGYGPQFSERAKARGWNATSVSEGLTPALSESTMKILSQPAHRGEVLNNLAAFYGKTDPALSARLAETATSGKKIITISGSGRGDYVATRALDMAKVLRRAGLSDKVQIVAQLAGAYDTPLAQRLLSRTPEVLMLPKMPPAEFQNLQRIADVHWGSTGTSSLAESMTHGNVLALPEDWGYREKWFPEGRSQRITPGTPAWLQDRHVRAMKDPSVASGHVPVTTWNRGNMQYAHSRPGVLAANRGSDILKLLQNPEALASMQQAAKLRSSEEMVKLIGGRKSLVESVMQRAVKNVARQQWGGRLKILGALGALGAGTHLMTRTQKPPTWFEQQRQKWFG